MTMTQSNTIAAPYAQALFLLDGKLKVKSWSNDLKLMNQLWSNPEVQAVYANPKVAKEKVLAIFEKALSGFSSMHSRFLHLLLYHHRMQLLPNIYEVYLDLERKAANLSIAKVTSAFPLSSSERNAIKKFLMKKFNATIELEESLDKNIIAGIKINIEDFSIDVSIEGKIKKFIDKLVR
jgi:F-type H+-transporting ATPase subunit delta